MLSNANFDQALLRFRGAIDVRHMYRFGRRAMAIVVKRKGFRGWEQLVLSRS